MKGAAIDAFRTVIGELPTVLRLTAWAPDQRGNITIVFATALVALVMLVGGGIDAARFAIEKSNAQLAVDTASLAGAKELSLSDSNRENVPSIVQAVVDKFLSKGLQESSSKGYQVATELIDLPNTPLQVSLTLHKPVRSIFGRFLGVGDIQLTVKAVATVVGKPNICLLALDRSAMGTIYLQKNAKVVGQNCAVYSNSVHPNGIKAFNSSLLTASIICSAGGKAGGKGNFVPDPLTDCPQFDDPLADRPEPDVGACTATNLIIDSVSATLDPGTYCGGVTLKGDAEVTFNPGVYMMKDGPLLVSDTAAIHGVNVGFYFYGAKARFNFATDTTINLTAPKSGVMAGLLFFGSRGQSNVVYQIPSDNARELLGTIYLPTGQLSIDANKPIADKSAYTAIVARKVTANSGPTIVLNSNYDATDVPVPNGIRGAGMPTILTR